MNIVARTTLIVALLAATAAAIAVPAPDANSANAAKAVEHQADRDQRRQEFFKHMSERMADRLEIKASQQAAFQAFTTSLQNAMTPPAQHTEYKSDAASIARAHADRAAEHARRLATIADATAQFQEVLTPDQRKTFDQMAAAFAHRRMHHRFGHHWGHEEGHDHDGHGHGDGHQGWGQDGEHT